MAASFLRDSFDSFGRGCSLPGRLSGLPERMCFINLYSAMNVPWASEAPLC